MLNQEKKLCCTESSVYAVSSPSEVIKISYCVLLSVGYASFC